MEAGTKVRLVKPLRTEEHALVGEVFTVTKWYAFETGNQVPLAEVTDVRGKRWLLTQASMEAVVPADGTAS